MENKNVFVLCMILLFVGSSLMFERVDCRVLRSKPFRYINVNDHDQSSATMKVKSSSTPLPKIYAYRLASGPSKRGSGH
ncbi:unnamed protein product [Arabidopsis lyrata]|uniref:Predicted protein n=1 Tax=Arabidopsis lyrata subsp. lyrata TaxID=81972 RepID=D7MQ21_ARALL|nr:uncharacterized protein LOC9301534 [Arabidopsis lyrata subsp. lyrata]EFH41719.1 predicted protein [Arabidopsis lyrata subsp. lyrata]CAH8278578.1 unnamed protein product [Arabidopsis lyrata]|eukprot:XP_020871228.1 uncharacterized protein LOC9301534 [Arabidopsis lyrata subsp. lyrata]